MMLTLIKIVGISLIIWKVFWYLMYMISIIDDDYTHYAKMKWSMIKKLYPINPKKWTYDNYEYENCCKIVNNYHNEYTTKDMRNLRYEGIPILLSFIDYQRLRYNFHRYGATPNKNALQNILEDVEKDIEVKRKESEREIEEAMRIMRGGV